MKKKKKQNLLNKTQNLLNKKQLNIISNIFHFRFKILKYSQNEININETIAFYNKTIDDLKLTINGLKKQNVLFFPSTVKYWKNNAKPFWNSKIKSISDKMSMPSFDNIQQIKDEISVNTWFKSSTYNLINTSDYKIEYNKPIINLEKQITNVRKIKLKMNTTHKYYLRQFIGIYRYFYNRCVSYINNYNKIKRESWYYIYPTEKDELDKKKIVLKIDKKTFYTDKCFVRKILKENKPKWIYDDFPSHLIDQALFECLKNFKKCMKNYIKKRKPFKFKYKKKHDNIQTMNIEKTMISKNSLFTNFKVDNKFVFRNIQKNIIPNNIKHGDSSISYDKHLNEVYVNVSYKVNKEKPKEENIGSLDPGIKNFMVCYSQNEIAKIGIGSDEKLYEICKKIDDLVSKMNKKKINNNKDYEYNANKRRNFRRAMHRKVKKLKNMKKELHNKTINYLCKKYSVIIIPIFQIKQMAKKLDNKSARSLYNLSHFEFRKKLIEKAKKNNITVHIRDEYYTSKTCGKCGNLKYDLGSNRTYNCVKCDLKIDRDINGARNIMLKSLSSI